MPAKGHKRNVGSHAPRCGDYGGVTTAGKPCRRLSTCLCSSHGGDGPEQMTEERTQAIVETLREGSYLITAALANGVSDAAVRVWLDLGADNPEGPYGDFARRVEEARAYAEANAASIVLGAGRGQKWIKKRLRTSRVLTNGKKPKGKKGKKNGVVEQETGVVEEIEEGVDVDWRAAAWWLERAHPGRWKPNVGSMKQRDGEIGTIKVTEIREHYTDDEIEEAVSAVAEG